MDYLYTARPVEAKALQHPEFAKRDIKGMTSGMLEKIHMVGVPGAKQLAYDGYVANLPAFLYATSVHAKVYCHKNWYKANISLNLTIPLRLPTLTVSSPTLLKKEQDKDNFKASLTVPVEVIRGPMGESYIIRNPTHSLLKTLNPLVHHKTPSLPDATSFYGLISYLTTTKILSLFLATHSYPAFPSPGSSNDVVGSFANLDFPLGLSSVISNYKGL
jgi:hypothetical protein